MMAGVVARLVFLDGFGEEEVAPVGDAADYTALGEDEGACCSGDSAGEAIVVREAEEAEWERG